MKLHHSVYYYHKQNKENSYKKANKELDKKIIEEYEKILLGNNVRHSYSKKGYLYDNASMESFNAI